MNKLPATAANMRCINNVLIVIGPFYNPNHFLKQTLNNIPPSHQKSHLGFNNERYQPYRWKYPHE